MMEWMPPPDGIAMCQGGDVCASHEERGHPGKKLALSASTLQSGAFRRMAPALTAAWRSARRFRAIKSSLFWPSTPAASSLWRPAGAPITGDAPSALSAMKFG